MRTLIFCMSYLKNETDGRLLRIWQEMIEAQNKFPFDLLVVNSKAALDPTDYLRWDDRWQIHVLDDFERILVSGPRHLIHFTNALGHPFHDGVREASGSDRALMMGFQTAINSSYDRVVYLEMDLLFGRPLQDAFDLMTKPAACLPLVSHGKFPENGLFIADVEHMQKIDFIRRYDWRGPCSPEGELRQWRIYGDDVQLLPFKGGRDGGATKPEELSTKYPEGIDYLTHATIETMGEFLRMKHLPDLAEYLCG